MFFHGFVTIALGLCLFRLVWIDVKTFRLPDIYTLPLIVIGILVNSVMRGELHGPSIWGAIFGYALFWSIGILFFHLRGREGLGQGDAKLFSAAGAWVGIVQLPIVMFVAAISAIGFVCMRRARASDPIAFGPWLALGFFSTWCWTLYQYLA